MGILAISDFLELNEHSSFYFELWQSSLEFTLDKLKEELKNRSIIQFLYSALVQLKLTSISFVVL